MSAFGLPLTGREVAPAEEGRRLSPPAEGWSTLVILMLMLFVIGWAMDDARWAGFGPQGVSETSFLPFAMMLGALVGFGFAKTRLSPLVVHLLASLIGAAYLLVVISGVISTAPGIIERLHDLNASAATFYNDLFVEGIRSAETSIFLLCIGTVAWGTGVFAAFNVFRRHRPMPAIVVGGLLLLLNVAVTIKAQYAHLVLFSLGAMLLLVRLNLMEQREGWQRRRIGDAGYVSGLFLRSGAVFVALTLVGAIVLSAAASSAPLARMWRDADSKIVQLGNELNRIVGGVTGAAKGPSALFSSTQTIRGVWESRTDVVFRAATSDGKGYYWRGATYDDFDGTTWQELDTVSTGASAPGSPILGGSADYIGQGAADRTEVRATITAGEFGLDFVLAPDSPLTLDRDAEALTAQAGGPFVKIEFADRVREGEDYTVSALVRDEGALNGGVTGNELAAAGTDYPAWIDRYLTLKPGAVGPVVAQVTGGIVRRLPSDQRDPYHVAAAIQDYFYSSGGFRFQTDVRELCHNAKLVDCFLQEKRGYCEYFATAMAVMLRSQGIPSRVALGYLPGKKLATGEWEIDGGAAHEWVEVYFPDYGWLRFDPTPGDQSLRANGQHPTIIAAGPALGTPGPGASATPKPRVTRDPRDDQGLGAGAAGSSIPPSVRPGGRPIADSRIIALALVLVLLLLMIGLGILARRRTKYVAAPDQAFRNMTRIASRFGYAPLPTQTAYEYAGTLADVVPRVAPELHLVALAKVEATYAARPPHGEGLVTLRSAYRRVRTGLLRLALRRKRRTGPRRIKTPRRK